MKGSARSLWCGSRPPLNVVRTIRTTRRLLAAILFLVAAIRCAAAKQPVSIDTGDCDPGSPAKTSVFKSQVFTDQKHNFRAFGSIIYRRNRADARQVHCHVVYQLSVSEDGKPFTLVYRLGWNLDAQELAGITLVKLSENGNQFAADFWIAQGDGFTHRPVVFNRAAHRSMSMALDDRIQRQIRGCDQGEDFIGVTNTGEAIFAVPPSIYDDSPGCGDKGLWYFNLSTGKVHRVRKNSGVKWR